MDMWLWLKYDIKRAIQIYGFAIFPLHNDSKICKAKDNAIESNIEWVNRKVVNKIEASASIS